MPSILWLCAVVVFGAELEEVGFFARVFRANTMFIANAQLPFRHFRREELRLQSVAQTGSVRQHG